MSNNSYYIYVPILVPDEMAKATLIRLIIRTPPHNPIILLTSSQQNAAIFQSVLCRDGLRSHVHIEVLESPVRGGYLSYILRTTKSPFCVIQPNVEVSAYWVKGLHQCAQSNPRAGIISPLTNKGDHLGFPFMGCEKNQFSDSIFNSMSDSVAQLSDHLYPVLPAPGEFCFLVTRTLRDGLTDRELEKIYDLASLSLAAKKLGFEFRCCDDVYVLDGSTPSSKLPPENSELDTFRSLGPLFPMWVKCLTKRICSDSSSAQNRLRIKGLYPNSDPSENCVALHFVRQLHPVDLNWCQIEKQILLFFGSSPLEFQHYLEGNPISLHHSETEKRFASLLEASSFEVLHFENPQTWGTLSLPTIGKAFKRTVVLELKDLFLLCPAHASEETIEDCGILRHNPVHPSCLKLLTSKSRHLGSVTDPQFYQNYSAARYEAVHRLFKHTDQIICRDPTLRRLYIHAYGLPGHLFKTKKVTKSRMKNEGHNSGPRKVPIQIRNSAYHLFRIPLVRQIGQMAYDITAQRFARKIQGFEAVQSVYLRGGSVHRCVPALSDLDFTVNLRDRMDPLSHGDFFRQARKIYCSTRTFYPMLGEVLVLDAQNLNEITDWGSAMAFHTRFQRKLTGEGDIERTNLTEKISLGARLIVALDCYFMGLEDWLCSRKESNYQRASFRRHMLKSLEIATARNLKSDSKIGDAELIAKAFTAMDELARLTLQSRFRPPYPITTGDFEPTRWNRETLTKSEQWAYSIGLTPTAIPYIFLLEPASRDSILKFFSQYLHRVRTDSRQELPIWFNRPPLVFSKNLFEAFKRGFSSENRFANLSIPGVQSFDPLWVEQAKNCMFEAHLERIRMQLLRTPGELISAEWNYVFTSVSNLCAETMAIASGHFSAHIHDIMELSEKKIPKTVDLFKRLKPPMDLSEGVEWIPSILSVLEEIRNYLPCTIPSREHKSHRLENRNDAS